MNFESFTQRKQKPFWKCFADNLIYLCKFLFSKITIKIVFRFSVNSFDTQMIRSAFEFELSFYKNFLEKILNFIWFIWLLLLLLFLITISISILYIVYYPHELTRNFNRFNKKMIYVRETFICKSVDSIIRKGISQIIIKILVHPK